MMFEHFHRKQSEAFKGTLQQHSGTSVEVVRLGIEAFTGVFIKKHYFLGFCFYIVATLFQLNIPFTKDFLAPTISYYFFSNIEFQQKKILNIVMCGKFHFALWILWSHSKARELLYLME